MRPISRTSFSDTGTSLRSLDVRFAKPNEVSPSTAIRLPLAKCVMRCDKYLRLISGGSYGLTRFGDGGKTRKFHGGVDLYAKVGTDCYAIADGHVEWADAHSATWGKAVLLRTQAKGKRVWVLYAHLSDILVGPSNDVTQGTVVGRTGVTGILSDPRYPHLHFEVWTSLKAGDPKTRDRFRLHPLDILGPIPYEPFANEVLDAAQRA